ncbi:MAG TPA: hypothetical protein VKU90_00485 [Caulobacteraceae bacterium]|nr:hypothetical protein [Caulobacteraceae bacterium]
MADEDVEVWSDGTQQRLPGAAPPPGSAPPPAYARPAGGLPVWAMVAGGLVLLALVGVLAVVLMRNTGGKTRPAQVASSAASAAASAGPAAAGPPMTLQAAAAQFGLSGVWAVDCSQAVSENNSYETIAAASDGTLSDVIASGPTIVDNKYRWDSGHLIGSDQIALDGVFVNDGSAMHVVIQRAGDGRTHVLSAIDGAGKQQVVNGAFPGGGAPPWQTKCSSG